jgi:uncharacterized Tic20 family protein
MDDNQRKKTLSGFQIGRILFFIIGILLIGIGFFIIDLRMADYFFFLALFSFIIVWHNDAKIKIIILYEKCKKK